MSAETAATPENPRVFDQVVFSGGGTRCFWQGGFMEVLRQEMPIWPARITGVSGGALTAIGFITHRGMFVRDTFLEVFDRQTTNLPSGEPFDVEMGNSPHQRLYWEICNRVIDTEAERQVAEGPSLQILIARPPSREWATTTGAASTLAYIADTRIRSSPHLAWPEAGGLTGELIDANAAAREGRLAELAWAAATIPPAFEPPLWDGEPAIDAGMVDQAPMPVPDEGTTMILLTKQFRDLPEVEGRLYLEPSEAVPADKIDFTDPDKLRRTWSQGEEDARSFVEKVRAAG